MLRIVHWAFFALLVPSMAFCCPCRKAQKTTDLPLVGTSWHLVQMNGRDIVSEPDQYSITFEGGNRLAGQGACNRLVASYEMTPQGGLTIGQAAMTRKACLRGMDTEEDFAKMLSEATHFEVEGDELMILTDGEVRGILRAN